MCKTTAALGGSHPRTRLLQMPCCVCTRDDCYGQCGVIKSPATHETSGQKYLPHLSEKPSSVSAFYKALRLGRPETVILLFTLFSSSCIHCFHLLPQQHHGDSGLRRRLQAVLFYPSAHPHRRQSTKSGRAGLYCHGGLRRM